MEKKLTPQQRWDSKNLLQFKMGLSRTTEQDIIEKLESVPNKSGYIKELIRADIEREKKQNTK